MSLTKAITLPTKRGIKTSWHGTAITGKTMAQQTANQNSSSSSSSLASVPEHDHSKRSKVEVVTSNQSPNMNQSLLSSQSQKPGIVTVHRKLRNCQLAKRSRVRKKFLFESLQGEVMNLQAINTQLRKLIQKHIPLYAQHIFDECCSKSPLLHEMATVSSMVERNGGIATLSSADYTFVSVLSLSQRNFILTDPRLPDNPIVFASPGFYEITGYTPNQVLGRNCRFLQGPGTDTTATQAIKTSIIYGVDVATCILNYKSDGQPFWNQLFIAALRDADDRIVNFVRHFFILFFQF